MKKLLFLLFPVFSYGQITINTAFTGYTTVTTDASAFGHSSKTFTAGRLYLFVAMTTGTTNPGTISGTTSSTWTSVVATGNSTRRIQVFRYLPASTISGETVNIGTFGGGSTGYSTIIIEITGAVTTGSNGADAILQTGTGGATGTNPSITLGSGATNGNAIISLFFNDANPFGGTEESGWTETNDDGYSTPTAGGYTMTRTNTTDNTPTVTASSSTWIGVAIELKSSGRRSTITN